MSQTLEDIRTLARPILLRLALVSTAPAGRMDGIVNSHRKPEHVRPSGEANPDYEYFARRLAEAVSVDEALRTVDEARDALAHATRRGMVVEVTETADELAERIVVDGSGWTVEDVASAMRCLPRFVRRARIAAGRDPETGYSVPGDPWAQARALDAQGRSYRTIAKLTGLPLATVHRRLSR